MCTPSHVVVDRVAAQHDRGPPGSGEAAAVGVRPHGVPRDDGDRLAAVGRGDHDELVDAEGEPAIVGHTLRHCSASSSSMPWTISA